MDRLWHRRDLPDHGDQRRFCRRRSSLPFAIAGPDGATVAVTATLVVALLGRLSAEGAPDDLLAPVMIVMGLSAALTGLLFFGLSLIHI